MPDIDKENTAYNHVLANYLLQQVFNANISALEQQTQWLQAGLSQTELSLVELPQVVLGQAKMAQTVGTLEEVEWPQRRWCRVSGYQATTFGMLPSLKGRIQSAVEKVEFLVKEFDNRDQFTDMQKWAIPGDIFECLKEVQTEEEVIGIARYAGFEATANRLVELRSYEEELDSNEQPLNPLSMKQLLHFLLNHRELKEPGITLTNEGNVKAIWRQSNSQIFWIEFFPNDDVRYLAFVPNEERSDRIERTAGLSTIHVIYDRARELHALDWMIG